MYKKYLPYLIGFILSALIIGVGIIYFFNQPIKNVGATVAYPQYGGTGKTSAVAGDIGKYLKVSNNSPFTYSFDTPAGGGGGSVINQLGQIGDVSTTTLAWGSVIRYNTSTSKWESVATSTLGLGGSSGTVSSVDLTLPAGLTYSGGAITTAGTFNVSLTSGYVIPTTTRETLQDTAYSWGNHALAGYLTSVASDSTWTLHNSYPAGCTNQFIRSFGDTNTCASVATTDFASANVSQWTNDSGYTTFAYPFPSAATSTPLTFTGLLTITNASTTQLTVSSNIYLPADSIEESDILFSTTCNSVSKLYISGGNLACNADQQGTGTGSGTIQHEEFTATAAQTVFNLSFTYITGTNQLVVSSNGLRMRLNDDYAETDTDTITFVSGRNLGDKITVDVFGGATTFGTVSTSTSPTIGDLAYWTSKNAWPETLGSIATSSLGIAATDLIGFSGGTGITYTTGAISFDCSEVEGTGIDCSGENITLDATGAWAGTLTNFNTYFDNRISATTTLPNITTLLGLTNASTTLLTVSGTTYLSTVMGAVDLSGATSFKLPQNGTIDATGEVKWDTTSGQLQIYNGTAIKAISPNLYPSFTYSTSTGWSGTTTRPLGTSFVAETWLGVQCFTDAGTLQVSFHDGTNRMNFMTASTTVGTITLNANNTFTASEKRYVDIGTPATAPTYISCTISKTITPD